MTINDKKKKALTRYLAAFIEDISEGKACTFCVGKHLSTLLLLQSDGYTIKSITQVLSEHGHINYNSFLNAIVSAKKKDINLKSANASIDDIQTKNMMIKSDNEILNKHDTPHSYTDEEWLFAIGFTINENSLHTFRENLESHGWTPYNYEKLKNKHNISDAKKLIKIIVDISRHAANRDEYL